jgi:hypothetical protein
LKAVKKVPILEKLNPDMDYVAREEEQLVNSKTKDGARTTFNRQIDLKKRQLFYRKGKTTTVPKVQTKQQQQTAATTERKKRNPQTKARIE